MTKIILVKLKFITEFTFVGLIFVLHLSGCTNPFNGALAKPSKTFIPQSLPSKQPIIKESNDTQPLSTECSSGTLYFTNHSGIYLLNLSTNDFSILDEEGNKIYSNITLVNNSLFFLKTTKSAIGFGQNEVYSISTNGKNLQRYTNDESWENFLRASPNNCFLTFTRKTDQYQLLVLDLNTGKSYKAKTSKQEIHSTSWSPDSKRFVFFEDKGTNNRALLNLYDLEKRTVTELLSNETIPATSITWSPDSTRIVLCLLKNGEPGIFTLDVTSQKLEKIATVNEIPQNLQWSPNGKYILYEFTKYASQSNQQYGLYLLNINSKEIKTIMMGHIDGRVYSYQARWSPNSNCIEFTYEQETEGWKIGILDVNTRKLTKIDLPESYDHSLESWILKQ